MSNPSLKALTLFSILALFSMVQAASDLKPNEYMHNPNAALSDEFSDDDRKMIESTSEKHGFDVEVSRLMDIIINSLYTHKEIFIRELISNSSDACDKVRFIAIQNPEFMGDKKECEIRIEYDKAAKTFSITDNGIGMTKNDLVKNLGTIAKSGTTSFIEAISKGQSLNLIGQFGVGFYSTYLVSNKVVVSSKNPDDQQHVWISQAGNTFEVIKDPRGNSLGRGTRVTLYLKDDNLEFNNQDVIRKNIKKYSEFINFPIYLRVNQTYTREEDVEEEKKQEDSTATNTTDTTEKKDDLDITDEAADKKEEKKPKKRTVEDWRWEWVKVNENQPIWLKNREDITVEEYNKFYKALTRESENNPIAYEHNYTEGEVNFKYILYIPDNKPSDLFENYYGRNSALKLYVKRVLVNEQFEELIPRYLNFVKGIVDSDDLPLNVSREQLQQHKMIKVMSKKLVRTVINMLVKLAANTESEDDEEEEEDEEDKDKKDKEKKPSENKYNKFWTAFGKNIKLGVIEDTANKTKLSKLLRFYSTKSENDLISLQDYVDRMKPGQEFIYYICGESRSVLKDSTFIQKLKARDIEVLLLDDPIDEYTMQNLAEFEKKKTKNVAKGDLKLDNAETVKAKKKALRKMYKPLIDWWKNMLDKKIENIVISDRLTDTPAIIVSSEYGYTANMERIQRSQAFANSDKTQSFMYGKKTLEINPFHPTIKELLKRVKETEVASDETKDVALLLFDSALLSAGYVLESPNEYAGRMDKVVKNSLGLDRFVKASPFETEEL